MISQHTLLKLITVREQKGEIKMKDNKDILIQIALMWAVQYEKRNKEACDMLLGYYKRELWDE